MKLDEFKKLKAAASTDLLTAAWLKLKAAGKAVITTIKAHQILTAFAATAAEAASEEAKNASGLDEEGQKLMKTIAQSEAARTGWSVNRCFFRDIFRSLLRYAPSLTLSVPKNLF